MRLYAAILLTCTACASAPKPAPSQPEEPIRTQDEIAQDQTSGAGPADPSLCTSHPNAPGCPGNRGKKGGAFDDSAHRNRFVHDESGHDNPGNPALQSR